MLVHEVMIREIEIIAPDATIDEAARMMADLDVRALPVAEGPQALRGILTDRDILIRIVACGRDPRAVRVEEAMSSHLFTCHAEDAVEDAVAAMTRHQVRRMPVLDTEGRMIGLVTLSGLERGRAAATVGTQRQQV